MMSPRRPAVLALASLAAKHGGAILLFLVLMAPAAALGSGPTTLGDCASVPGNCRTEGCEPNERSVPNSCSGDGEACCVYFCPGTCLSEAAGCTYPRERVSGVCANKTEVCCSLSGTSTTGSATGGTSAPASPTGGWAAGGSAAGTAGTGSAKATTGSSDSLTGSAESAGTRAGSETGGAESARGSDGSAALERAAATASGTGAGCPDGYTPVAGFCFPTGTGLSERPVLEVVTNFANWLLAIFGFIAILGFVISGIQYLTSAGDESQAETAKRNMKYSIIGVIVALSGWVVVQFVDGLLKASL